MASRPIWYELITPDARSVAPFYSAVLHWNIPDAATKMSNSFASDEVEGTICSGTRFA